MKITIKGTRTEISLATRSLIEEKFGAIEKFIGESDTAMLSCEIEESVSVERAGAKYRAEGNLSVNGKLFRAEAMGATLEMAVDTVRDDLIREVRRMRGKERGFLKRGGAAVKAMLRGWR